MISKAILREFISVIHEVLPAQDRLMVRGLGTFKIESIPSVCEQVNSRKFVVNPPSKRIVLEHTSAEKTDSSLVEALASRLGIPHEESEVVIHLLSKEIVKQIPTNIPGLGAITQSEDEVCFTADPELLALIAGRYGSMSPVEITQSIAPQKKSQKNSRKYFWAFLALCIVAIGGYLILDNRDLFQSTAVLPGPPVADSSASTVSSDSFSVADDAIIRIDAGKPPPELDRFSATDDLTDVPSLSLPSEEITEDVQTEVPVIDRKRGGYTIIIGSFASPDQANRVVEQFRALYPELPVDTLQSPEKTRYRVAIGQVPTSQEAVALQNRLDDLPAGTWILNILNKDI